MQQLQFAFVRTPKIWAKEDIMSLLPLIASAVKQYEDEVSQTIKTSLVDAERELRLSAQQVTPLRSDKEQRQTQIEQEQREIAAREEAEKRRREAAATLKLA